MLEKTLEGPLACKEIQPVHSKDQSWVLFGRNDAKAESPILWPPYVKSWLIGKDADAGRDWRQEEKGMIQDEMAWWHHGLDGRESEWTPGDGDAQGGLACCNSWGRKESDMTERLNWLTDSAYKLNKQPWCTPFPIWNQSVVPCPVLTVASWTAYRFLKWQIRRFGIPISWRIFHSLLWSTESKALVYSVPGKIHKMLVIIKSLFLYFQFSSVQLLSRVWIFATPWIAARQASLSITNSRSSLTHVHWVSDAIQPSHPLSSPSSSAPNPSRHQSLFQWVNSSHEVAKVLEFQL